MIDITPRPWMSSAVCATVDPELFFPETQQQTYQIRQAKAICGGCPVIADCLNAGLQPIAEGIWGGATVNERKSIKRGIRNKQLHIDTLRKQYIETQKRMEANR